MQVSQDSSEKLSSTCALSSQGRQGLYRFAGFAFGQAKFVKPLEVEPEFPAGAEEVSQPQCRITGNGTLSVEDFGDAVGWHVEVASEGGGAHVERFQLFCEMFAGMNCNNIPHNMIHIERHLSGQNTEEVITGRVRAPTAQRAVSEFGRLAYSAANGLGG